MTLSPPAQRPAGGAVLVGLILIALGGAWLAEAAGWVEATALILTWWPLALVVIGVWWALQPPRLVGLVVAGLGVVLLLNRLEVTDIALGALIGPALLVAVGATLLHTVGWGVDALRNDPDLDAPTPPVGRPAASAVLGDVRLAVEPRDATLGVRVLPILGDVRVDLPPGWQVHDHTTRPGRRAATATAVDPDRPGVEVTGSVLLGDLHLEVSEMGR